MWRHVYKKDTESARFFILEDVGLGGRREILITEDRGIKKFLWLVCLPAAAAADALELSSLSLY